VGASKNHIVRGQTLSSMGESFFFPCTRHISMYLHTGIVILSVILPHGVLFFISVLRHYYNYYTAGTSVPAWHSPCTRRSLPVHRRTPPA